MINFNPNNLKLNMKINKNGHGFSKKKSFKITNFIVFPTFRQNHLHYAS